MDDEIQLLSDGDGMAVIGNAIAVERFLESLGLLSASLDLGLHRLGAVLRTGILRCHHFNWVGFRLTNQLS